MPSEPLFGRYLIFASLTCLIDAICKKRYRNQNVYILSILCMTRSKPVNRTAFCCLFLTTALILTACSSGGGGSGSGGVAADIGTGLADALTTPLDHKDKGLKSLTLEDSIPQNGTLTLSAQGAEKTFKAGDKDNSLNTGKLKNDKISRFDFVQKIEVDGQTITLASGEFQIYKQDHSAVVALQIEKINNPDKIDSLINQRSFLVSGLGGEHTAFNQLPGGKAEYHGKAFSSDDAGGKLTYTIDFAAKQGHGKIEHLKTPEQNVELAAAELKADEKSHAVILGDTRYGSEEKGTYHLALFGDRAQEIAGSATVKIGEKVHEIGIAGKQ
ncbi:TPA: factor H binding family protein [Neisseria meningitidis]|nr:factor H binding family protein [Neisseria meningitidis]MCG3364035.1 factor H binding family protein [Neisseria meningitidis]MCG3365654.1 factor H binding family protein [Neisseria meningitidis]MCG3368052.1 factor H binding family protein [Neisseria meningitidis]MCL5838582.1 factor H binding family protein [Neisseria meningitidis]